MSRQVGSSMSRRGRGSLKRGGAALTAEGWGVVIWTCINGGLSRRRVFHGRWSLGQALGRLDDFLHDSGSGSGNPVRACYNGSSRDFLVVAQLTD